MAWVSPTGFVDPDGKWGNIPDYEEDKAYDGSLVTMAMSDEVTAGQWSSYLELTIDAISCDKIRFNTMQDEDFIDLISIDVYYEDDWHNIYEGSYPNEIWTEKAIPAGTKSVTAARVKFHNNFFADIPAELYEFEFNSVVVIKELSGLSEGVALVSGSIARDLAFSGLSTGVCSVTGFIAIDRALAGLSQGIASVSGAIVRDLALAGISSGVASISATLQRARGLSGTVIGVAQVTGSIIISPGVWLSGASAGVALVSGSLSRIRLLAGISAGVSSVSGLFGILKLLSGLSAGEATVTGRLGRTKLAIRNLAAVRNLPPVRTLPWE